MTQDQLDKVYELLDKENAGLSETEIEFLDNLNDNDEMTLSEKQDSWLTKIWNRIFDGR